MLLKYFHLFLTFIVLNTAYNQQIDYSEISNWAIHPENKNDQLKKYINDSSIIEKADVFYIYPTVFLDRKDPRWNIEIEDSIQKWNIDNRAVRFQASAWAESGRMFIPYYRQANIRAYDQLDGRGREALLFAYNDVKTAFEYYLKNYNQGRPIILAGHSQGSTHLSLLLKEYFDKKPLMNQLVVAYIPGIGIDLDLFDSIPLLTKPTETGGFVSWNTFKMNKFSDKYEKWYKGKNVVNPISWDTSKKTTLKEHKGFLFWNNKLYTNSVRSKTIDGAICIAPPNFPYKYLVRTMKDYHLGDVNLFWMDIRENSKLRVLSFVKNKN